MILHPLYFPLCRWVIVFASSSTLTEQVEQYRTNRSHFGLSDLRALPMAISEDDLVAAIKRLSIVGRCYSAADMEEALRLSHGLQQWSMRRYIDLIARHCDRPALFAYQGDAWGSMVTEKVALSFPGTHVRQCRNGRYRHEFLLQRSCYRFLMPGGGQIVGSIFSEPVGLRDGKTALHCFAGALEHCSLPRQLGHRGIPTSVYVQDGALHKPLSRLFMARHSLFYTHGPELGDEHAVLENTDFVLALRCISHCASSAVKWGLSHLEGPATIDNIFIGIAGLRNASAPLICKVREFVFVHAHYTNERTGPVADREVFWRALQIAPHLIDDFVEADLCWDGRRLHCNVELQRYEDSLDRLADLVLYVLQWQSCSLTRWIKVGPSARMYLRSLVCGVAGLVELCRLDDHTSMYHLNGFFKAKGEDIRYLAAVALCTYPCETYLAEVMTDDRVLKRYEELRDMLQEELVYLCGLPDYVWTRLASLVPSDIDGREMRHLTLEASYRSVGYLHQEFFLQSWRHCP